MAQGKRKNQNTSPRKTGKTAAGEEVAAKAMDPSVREQTTPVKPSNNPRDAYAVLTLVNEVMDLFPETSYETSGPNSFNTNLVVAFDDSESSDLYPLLTLVESDARVLRVDRDSIEHRTFVEFHNSFRTQDSRAPFGLAGAHDILTAGGDVWLDENHDFVVREDDSTEDDPDYQDGDASASIQRGVEEGQRLASQRDDLIAAGADPTGLLVPIHPDDAEPTS